MSDDSDSDEFVGQWVTNAQIPVHIRSIIPSSHYQLVSGKQKLKRKWQSVRRGIRSDLTAMDKDDQDYDDQESVSGYSHSSSDDVEMEDEDASDYDDDEEDEISAAAQLPTNKDDEDDVQRSGVVDTRRIFAFAGSTPRGTKRRQTLTEVNQPSPLQQVSTPGTNQQRPQSRRATLIKQELTQAADTPRSKRLRDNTPLKRFRLRKDNSTSVAEAKTTTTTDTPRTRSVRRRNELNNAIEKLKDNASDSDSDAFVELSSDEESASDDSSTDNDENDEPDNVDMNAEESRREAFYQPMDDEDDAPAMNGGVEDDEDDDDEMDEQEKFNKMSEAQKRRFLQQSTQFKNFYDNVNASKGAKASNNSVSQLPVLEEKEYRTILSKLPIQNHNAKEQLKQLQKMRFPQLKFELSMGFNLLLYGFGSKRQILLDFAESQLEDDYKLILNGYSPALCLRQAFAELSSTLFQYNGAQGTLVQQAQRLVHLADQHPNPPHVYLIIHNIDGPSLRTDGCQKSLATLVGSPYFHILCSADHLHTFLMWDALQSSKLQFIYHDMTTFAHYQYETENEIQNGLLSRLIRMEIVGGRGGGAGSTGQASVRGILFVMKSLTDTAKNVFRILAECQLEQLGGGGGSGLADDGDDLEEEDGGQGWRANNAQNNTTGGVNQQVGMVYQTYFRRCREAFLTSSDMNFRTQLTEFRDHDIIRSRTCADGELFYIPLNKNELHEILSQISKN